MQTVIEFAAPYPDAMDELVWVLSDSRTQEAFPRTKLPQIYKLLEQYGEGKGMDFLTSKVTTILIVINIVIFLLETKDGGSTNRDVALKYGAQYQPYIREGQYYRLFTAMFLHFGVYHLLLNMYALSAIGPAVDYVCGPVIFLIVYLGAGLAGNVATMILDEKRGSSNLSAGASGCIFGLLGACFVLAVHGYGFSMRSILTTLAINLVYGLSSKRINMMSHAGGFVGGATIMAVIMAVLAMRR